MLLSPPIVHTYPEQLSKRASRIFHPDPCVPLRVRRSAAWVGNQLIVYGGLSEGDAIDELVALDLATWTWTVHTPADIDGLSPIPRFGHSATPYQRLRADGTAASTMVVVGGATDGFDLLR